MLSNKISSWTFTILTASLAVALAVMGLALVSIAPAAAPLTATALLGGSLTATALSFSGLALRLRRIEMENMGLIEEISQEFDRVKDKIEIFGDALTEPTRIPVENENTPLRRVTIK